ncbi:hypothetical protein [Nitrosopumilus sp.]|uniref:hypothetical protein n=1 Tax=Nitrosopumilus sp. TaxID=2024843 RepID=UPI00247B91E4|nr:hypothetical protein [Nitrosopumilus sp.]MCV0429973.1 hypothetical protein [Nitrosopumilus sp.]
MVELPENFPEYSIMYKTLSKQIKSLQKRLDEKQGSQRKEIEVKIQRYESEILRIKKKFPDNFFEELN